MSTTPALESEQQQPPPLAMTQQDNTSHSGHGSIGPVIGVLAMIAIFGALAVMVGRLCSGRRIMGHGQYDIEGWVEAKCSTCLDGRVDPPRPRTVAAPPSEAVPAASREGKREERKEEEIAQNNHHHPHERAES